MVLSGVGWRTSTPAAVCGSSLADATSWSMAALSSTESWPRRDDNRSVLPTLTLSAVTSTPSRSDKIAIGGMFCTGVRSATADVCPAVTVTRPLAGLKRGFSRRSSYAPATSDRRTGASPVTPTSTPSTNTRAPRTLLVTSMMPPSFCRRLSTSCCSSGDRSPVNAGAMRNSSRKLSSAFSLDSSCRCRRPRSKNSRVCTSRSAGVSARARRSSIESTAR